MLTTLLLASALAAPALTDIDEKPLSEVWLNPGFYTYHFKRDIDLNDRNPGGGVEYRFSTVSAVAAGRFYNSDWGHSTYVGYYWQPWSLGPVRLGAAAGLINGYPKLRDGGWFPTLIPIASIEYGRVGLTGTLVPPAGARLRAGISLQLRIKLN